MVLFKGYNNTSFESNNQFSLLLIESPSDFLIESYFNQLDNAINRWSDIYKINLNYRCIIYDPDGNPVFYS